MSVHRIALAGVLAAPLCIAVATGGFARSTINPDYSGRFFGDQQAQARIYIHVKEGDRLTRGRAQIKHLQLECDDGTTPRRNFPPLLIRFKEGGPVFDGRNHEVTADGQTFLQVHGRLVDNARRARGYAYWIEDVDDPVEAGRSDCSTVFPDFWNAHEV